MNGEQDGPVEQAEKRFEEAVVSAAAKPARSDAEKQEIAAGIYLAWRNANLGGLPTDVFNRVDAASPALISEIANNL